MQLDSLYRPEFERDSCGFGLIAHIHNKPSHWLVKTAIDALARLTHRGAVAADGKSGDGCGILMKKPDRFLRQAAADRGWQLGENYAVGNVFLSPKADIAASSRRVMEDALQAQGLEVAGWREVPTDDTVCGAQALAMLPTIEQVFVKCGMACSLFDFERKLYGSLGIPVFITSSNQAGGYVTVTGYANTDDLGMCIYGRAVLTELEARKRWQERYGFGTGFAGSPPSWAKGRTVAPGTGGAPIPPR